MSKITIKDLYLIFGNDKQHALRMLKEEKSKSEILKATGCTVAVKDANLSIREGEIFVIMGLSGSGKSTLLRCINRLIKPTSGEVIINGRDISNVTDKELLRIRRKELAMVFQHFGLLPHRSVLHNIAFGLELQGVKKQEREQRAMESMQLVGLKGYENQMVGELSGGMQQRVGLARALANDPEVLLMDEAFSALDPLIRIQMQDELLTLQSKMKKTIVFITHDLGVVANIADRVAVLYAGQIIEFANVEELFYDPRHPYTWALLSSLPQLAERNTKLFSITGTPPSLYNKIIGDPFAPRNQYCLKIDTLEEPPMFKVTDTHYAKTWLLDPRAPKTEKPEAIQNIHEKLLKAYNL